MRDHHPCGGIRRRTFFAAAAAAFPVIEGVRRVSAAQPKAAADPKQVDGKLGIPGPYPGRVIEARNRAASAGNEEPRRHQGDRRQGDEVAHRDGRRGRGLAKLRRAGRRRRDQGRSQRTPRCPVLRSWCLR